MSIIRIPYVEIPNCSYFDIIHDESRSNFLVLVIQSLRGLDSGIGDIKKIDSSDDSIFIIRYYTILNDDQKALVRQSILHLFEEIHDHV